jgi:hypothetical protein
MIKLTDILNELSKPEKIYEPGHSPIDQEKEFYKKGFKLSNPIEDPETGSITSDVVNLPKFEEKRKELMKFRKELEEYKYSSNPDIIKMAKEIDTLLANAGKRYTILSKMIETYKNS